MGEGEQRAESDAQCTDSCSTRMKEPMEAAVEWQLSISQVGSSCRVVLDNLSGESSTAATQPIELHHSALHSLIPSTVPCLSNQEHSLVKDFCLFSHLLVEEFFPFHSLADHFCPMFHSVMVDFWSSSHSVLEDFRFRIFLPLLPFVNGRVLPFSH